MFSSSVILTMGAQWSKQIDRQKAVIAEKKILRELQERCGSDYPGSNWHPTDRKNWMSGLDQNKVHINMIVWPGTHNSATNKIGIKMITRPFAQCQSLSIYQQLVCGARVLDIRVEETGKVCHGILTTYSVDFVIEDVKRFVSETKSEIVILEIRTEWGRKDPPEFQKYLWEQLGEMLIHQDDNVFDKTIAEILPRRVICVWKPRVSPEVNVKSPFWNSGYLRDNWIDTDLPATKFESNMKYLSQQQPVMARNYFYRVENTVTPQADNPIVCVKPVTKRIHGYGRLFIAQCFQQNCVNRLQIFSIDFINEDFVDACVGLTWAKLEGKA
ncbi:putative phosphoinositide phospholipase C, Phosphatidylinositol diacylglycerol-lyase [Helianthus anomalus]